MSDLLSTLRLVGKAWLPRSFVLVNKVFVNFFILFALTLQMLPG